VHQQVALHEWIGRRVFGLGSGRILKIAQADSSHFRFDAGCLREKMSRSRFIRFDVERLG
jgi:hypothetical protein